MRGAIPAGVHFAAIPDTLYALNLLGEGVAGETPHGTPWRTGVEQTYGASLRGGLDNVTYFLSGEFTDQEGTLTNNENVQRSLRANFDLVPSERVSLGLSAGYTNTRLFMPDNDNNAFGYIGVGMLGSPWEAPLKRTDLTIGGEWTTCPVAYEIHRALVATGFATDLDSVTEGECADNPFFGERTFEDIATLVNSQQVERVTTSATLDFTPFDFVTARGTVGYDQFVDQTGFLVPVDPELPFNDASRGLRGIDHSANRLLTLEGNVNATFDLAPELRSTTSVGAQFFRRSSSPPGPGERRFRPVQRPRPVLFEPRGSSPPARRAHSALHPGAARVSRPALRHARPPLRRQQRLRREPGEGGLSPLHGVIRPERGGLVRRSRAGRLRGVPPGAGRVGRVRQAARQLCGLKLLGPRRVTLRGENVAGYSLVGPGNPELRAERGQEVELGFEADLVDGRFGVDFTWFSQTTKDAIVATTLAPSTGYTVPVFRNIGEIRNGGVELGLSALVVNSQQLRWDWQLNAAHTTGEITDLDEHIIFGLGGDSQRHEEGFPFGSYFSQTYTIDSSGSAVASDTAVFVGQPTPELGGIAVHLARAVRLADALRRPWIRRRLSPVQQHGAVPL